LADLETNVQRPRARATGTSVLDRRQHTPGTRRIPEQERTMFLR
jgi:hypothetical protein